ncbi:carbohydrate ABC transporter membrane protein 1 (CUT1 family) [Rhizobium sp. PP-F2F-G38]|uniref:Sugar ABC transporter permease n=1 Tax=Ferranicluibacter rubi TaxID=2715133 RepID=A0AA43ZG15_9HYPH|nr:sugar ABC transporter permease [Ferranicluibacter rubi]PYE32571.1 carbohydrate ABC transporter membrane protein 1 (CUT1 family) [Rhizobium sp. PP-WC-1G-195]PYE42974.1 carbohydrate ABC transporter membrane protein 1 (CUT1 family) [Rhizobium sp. PP-F2F-G20b]PYE96000.1 carbohydrate ABC transporter membrane protein 1 (CUT1 family) [Rhizobium sp. PP-F2F-G38]TCP88395.1 carbohydrate ABC transporter membrane protein 1 (CUT1 family) [Rhizobium sp. PP-CC-2G-626]TCQ08771.1 carbohydrate ABC transporter
MSIAQVKRIAISDSPWPWLLPLVALLVVFTVYPLIYNIWLSFHEFVPKQRVLKYVGMANWIQLVNDGRFWGALGVTFLYFFIALTVEIILGMSVAMLLDAELPGFAALRAILSMTLVIPPAIAGMMFLLMEDSQFGVLSYFLGQLGLLDKSTPILGTSSLALLGVLVAEIWQWTPFMVLIFMAGLRSLPAEPYEAASIDGASSFQMFRRLTLPMMSRVIAVAVLLRGIDLFRVFDYVFVMTSGGPGTATYTVSLYAWQQTFSFLKWGYGATLSLTSLVIVMVMANLFIRVAKVRW